MRDAEESNDADRSVGVGSIVGVGVPDLFVKETKAVTDIVLVALGDRDGSVGEASAVLERDGDDDRVKDCLVLDNVIAAVFVPTGAVSVSWACDTERVIV